MVSQEQGVHDPSRWRLLDERGRQTWHYMESDEQAKEWPQSLVDKHHLGMQLVQTRSLLDETTLNRQRTGSTRAFVR